MWIPKSYATHRPEDKVRVLLHFLNPEGEEEYDVAVFYKGEPVRVGNLLYNRDAAQDWIAWMPIPENKPLKKLTTFLYGFFEATRNANEKEALLLRTYNGYVEKGYAVVKDLSNSISFNERESYTWLKQEGWVEDEQTPEGEIHARPTLKTIQHLSHG